MPMKKLGCLKAIETLPLYLFCFPLTHSQEIFTMNDLFYILSEVLFKDSIVSMH